MIQDRHKYRAWFNFADGGWRMIDLTGFYFAYSDYSPDTITVVDVDYDKHHEGELGTDCILMQSTGLKDSEGKLVYEGDVVRIWHPDEGIKYISPVMWKYGAWCIYHENRVDYQTGERACVGFGYWIPEALNRITVLGNIYENPELLEADEK